MSSTEAVEGEIAEVKAKISAVESKIKKVEKKIEEAEDAGNETAVQRRVKQREQLQEEKIKLLEEKNKLLEERLQLAGADTEQLRAVIREEFDRRDQMQKEPKSVSKVGSQEAEKLLAALGLQEVDGHKIDPIELPPNLAPSAEFDYSQFPNEDAGTPFLLEHHKQQLEKFGVKFGRTGFDVYDLHSKKSVYEFKSPSGQVYKGAPDGSVAPFGLFESSAALQTRILYKHKQNDQQKRKYREEHPDQFKDSGNSSKDGPVQYGDHKGQGITITLGAYAFNNYPLIMDLTDGVVHHLLHIRGIEVFVWKSLSATQAYFKEAELLKSSQHLSDRRLQLESIPEDLQAPLKKLRVLKMESGLQEQLESVMPFLSPAERLSCSQEIIASWVQAAPSMLPTGVQEMFG